MTSAIATNSRLVNFLNSALDENRSVVALTDGHAFAAVPLR